MPTPLNSRSGFQDPKALVVLRGDDFNRLFAIWRAVELGSLRVVYSANLSPGFSIPTDLSAPVTLVLPKPSPADLGFTSEEVTFWDAACRPVVRTVLTGTTTPAG